MSCILRHFLIWTNFRRKLNWYWKKISPTQKPLKILSYIIKIATNHSDLVFDPFMGVGSTGEASLVLGRQFVGFELDDSYFNASEKRLREKELNAVLV